MRKIFNFVREVKQELRKVIWPERKTVFLSAVTVIVSVVIFSLFFLAVDGISHKVIYYFSNFGA